MAILNGSGFVVTELGLIDSLVGALTPRGEGIRQRLVRAAQSRQRASQRYFSGMAQARAVTNLTVRVLRIKLRSTMVDKIHKRRSRHRVCGCPANMMNARVSSHQQNQRKKYVGQTVQTIERRWMEHTFRPGGGD
jgi:hypothetical protein